MKKRLFIPGLLALVQTLAALEVPAFTAFHAPDPNHGAERTDAGGLRNWDEETTLTWFGHFSRKGELTISLKTAGDEKGSGKLKIAVSPQEKEGGGWSRDGKKESGGGVSFGSGSIAAPGYHRITLSGRGKDLPDLDALVLDGPAAEDARFSTVERRNSASVHLGYPVPEKSKDEIEWFYLEVTPRTDPLWSYYMATGWHRGYFGMQVNSPTERRIIFSVWDAGGEAVDRGKVAKDNRVKLIAKGPKTNAGDFGNEGTGGHSHLVYPWKLGDTVHFLMRAQVEGDATTYTGWFRDSKSRDWELVSSFLAPRDGKQLHGLYSFNENFGGQNGHERRVCEFGNGWVRTLGGKWIPLTTAAFTHDGHGKSERLDRSAGLHGKRFYLANGGFVEDATKGAVTTAYDKLEIRSPEGRHPDDRELPTL